jgi:hypothetical protein
MELKGNQCGCRECGNIFASPMGFEAHRVKGACLTPKQLLRRFWKDEGDVWNMGKRPLEPNDTKGSVEKDERSEESRIDHSIGEVDG